MLKKIEKKIKARLQYLKDLDLDPDDHQIRPDSEKDFLKFMESHRNLDYPLIGMHYNGNLCIEWRDTIEVSLTFEGKNKVNFVFGRPGKRNHVSGVLVTGELKKIFTALKIWQYMTV